MTRIVIAEKHRIRARAFAAFMVLNPETNAPWTQAQIESLAAKIAIEAWAASHGDYSIAVTQGLIDQTLAEQ